MGAETPAVFGDSWAGCTLLASNESGTGSCSAYTARVHTAQTPPVLRLLMPSLYLIHACFHNSAWEWDALQDTYLIRLKF